jgi:hypothetical protein
LELGAVTDWVARQAAELLRQLRAATTEWFAAVRSGLQEPYAFEQAKVRPRSGDSPRCVPRSLPVPLLCEQHGGIARQGGATKV